MVTLVRLQHASFQYKVQTRFFLAFQRAFDKLPSTLFVFVFRRFDSFSFQHEAEKCSHKPGWIPSNFISIIVFKAFVASNQPCFISCSSFSCLFACPVLLFPSVDQFCSVSGLVFPLVPSGFFTAQGVCVCVSINFSKNVTNFTKRETVLFTFFQLTCVLVSVLNSSLPTNYISFAWYISLVRLQGRVRGLFCY